MPANRAKPKPACVSRLTSRILTEPPRPGDAKPHCAMTGFFPLIPGTRRRALRFVLTGTRPRLCDSIVTQTCFSRKSRKGPAPPLAGGRVQSHPRSAPDARKDACLPKIAEALSATIGHGRTFARPRRFDTHAAGFGQGLAVGPHRLRAAASADRFGSWRRGRPRRWRRLRTCMRPAWSCRNCACPHSDRRGTWC